MPAPPPVSQRPPNQPTVVDRAMEFAVQRLAKVIHTRDNAGLLDKAEDTRRLLDDISKQVSRLRGEESDSAAADVEKDSSWQNEEEEEREDMEIWTDEEALHAKQGSDHAERPTPYDLWARRREKAMAAATPEAKKNPPRLSEGQWNHVIDRLYASLKTHNIHVAETQRALIAKEMTESTFAPRINERSRAIASKELSIVDRTAIIEERKARRLRQERERLAEKESEVATFRPKINDHSRALAATTGSRLFDSPKERHAETARKVQEEREAADRAHPFSPVINTKSREIGKGKALAMAFSPAKRTDPSAKVGKSESFTPTINATSRRLAAGYSANKSVHDRLYDESVDSAKRAKERLAQEASASKSRSNKGAVVVYRPDMDFILETLGRDIR
jgi:hypothetical protein